jgi:restriction system protein
MARGSGSHGSYRQWEAAELRAQQQAARQKEQRRKARERERAVAEATARDEDAASRTRAVEQQVAALESLLRSSLARDPRISLTALRRQVTVPPLDLGNIAIPPPAPEWAEFAPEQVRGLRRMFGGQERYEAAVEVAEQAFRQAEEDHRRHKNSDASR